MRNKRIEFNTEKNDWLKKERGISFEEVIRAIESEAGLLDDVQHSLHKHQHVFVINMRGYAYNVPYVEDEEKIFLKTAYPIRKAKKIYKLK